MRHIVTSRRISAIENPAQLQMVVSGDTRALSSETPLASSRSVCALSVSVLHGGGGWREPTHKHPMILSHLLFHLIIQSILCAQSNCRFSPKGVSQTYGS